MRYGECVAHCKILDRATQERYFYLNGEPTPFKDIHLFETHFMLIMASQFPWHSFLFSSPVFPPPLTIAWLTSQGINATRKMMPTLPKGIRDNVFVKPLGGSSPQSLATHFLNTAPEKEFKTCGP